LFHVKLCIYL